MCGGAARHRGGTQYLTSRLETSMLKTDEVCDSEKWQ